MGKNVLYIRLKENEAEKIYLKIAESGMTINNFVVRVLLKADAESLACEKENKKILKEIFVEVKRIGNNLNQIARRANMQDNCIKIQNELKIILEESKKISQKF